MTMPRAGLFALVFLGGPLAIPGDAAAQKKEHDRISREELLKAADKFQDLFAAIRSLRPHFLAPPRPVRSTNLQPSNEPMQIPGMPNSSGPTLVQGNTRPPPIVIYVDGVKLGDTDHLKTMPTRNIAEVRYLSPTQAGSEFGLGHDGGAILVKVYNSGPQPPPAG